MSPTVTAPVVTPTTAPATASVTSATISPATVDPGGTIQITVQVSGTPSSVEVYLGSGAPNAPAPITFTTTASGPDTWTASGTAPATPGTYHYTVGLFSAAGHRIIADNNNWNIEVTGSQQQAPVQPTPQVQAQAQALPADVPLAPPFSYGDPVAATFSADGQTINGSEVSSTTMPSVSVASVADFYDNHLARAGWNVLATSGDTGSSYSATATNGGQVLVVEYTDGTVHLFYGTLSG